MQRVWKQLVTNKVGLLASLVCLMSSGLAYADEIPLEEVKVTASGQALNDIAQPVRVLTKNELDKATGQTLGELLDDVPGVANASFGSGVGRPVIRGLSGNRIKLAINGSDVADVSAMSSDHAPMVDAANAKQVEVIYGPNTLLFGSGAMGGVVNLADDRFHEFTYRGVNGEAQTEFSSNHNGYGFSGSLNAGTGRWIGHIDGFSRGTDDYEDGNGVTVRHTDTESQGVNLGVNYIDGGRGYYGLALSSLDYQYGVPTPDNEEAVIAPTQLRVDSQFGWHYVHPNLELIKLNVTHIDYEHDERLDGFNVGFFEKDNTELKAQFHFLSMLGWQSKLGVHWAQSDLGVCHTHNENCNGVPDYSDQTWDGTQGVSLQNSNGFLLADDTPMPLTETQDLGFFLIAERPWQRGILEWGVRFDERDISADPVSINPDFRKQQSYYADQSFSTLTLSTAMTWQFASQKVGVSLAQSQRAPTVDELYWNGDHHATFSFQLDNPNLNEETAYSLDITWAYQLANVHWQVGAFYYDFDGYIYNQRQDFTDPFHGNIVYRHTQADAWFTGAELAAKWQINRHWQLDSAFDVVKAQLKQGENKNLPRTPPASMTLALDWQTQALNVSAQWQYFAEQTDVAQNETSTDAYSLIGAQIAYDWVGDTMLPIEFRFKANNLTNELGRNHVSYLKDYSPIIGRHFELSIGTRF